jgi:bacterioferritin-associated ferredoxin
LRKVIVKAIDPEWLAEIEDENVGFNRLSPQQLLNHLRIVGGSLDHVDVTELIQALQKLWDHVEAPATMFARGDKIECQLIKAGQPANPELRLAFALSTFEASGEFEAPLCEWKARPLIDRTFAKFRVFLQKEYANRNKHNKTTAQSTGRGIANALTDATMDKVDEVEAAAMAVAEIAQALQAQQNEQMKQMMEMFKTFMQYASKASKLTCASPCASCRTEAKEVLSPLQAPPFPARTMLGT